MTERAPDFKACHLHLIVQADAAQKISELEQRLAAEGASAAEAVKAAEATAAEAAAAAQAQLAAAQDAAAAAQAAADKMQQELKTQIDGLNAKLVEAAGALRAKEELKEERYAGSDQQCRQGC